MELGFLNSCLMEWPPERVVGYAASAGFSAIELHGGPRYRAVAWRDVAGGQREAVDAVRGPLERYGIRCSGIMYGALPLLSSDSSERQEASEYLRMLLRAAHQLGVPVVSTFAGRALELDLSGNVDRFKEVFSPLVEEAEKLNISVALENCAMTQGFQPPTNIAYAPVIWAELFDAIPSASLCLNFDPSHLQWMGADVVNAVRIFGKRICHVQAKDAEVLPSRLAETTYFADGWWRYRLPGYGQVPWRQMFSALREVGYEGVISIEHEDPVWSGTEEKVLDGLDRAAKFLCPLL